MGAIAQMKSTKKNAVAEAALALFMKKGIKATTTRDIANRAGVSEGTIYRHYENKESLAQEIFDKTSNQFAQFLSQNLCEVSNPELQISSYVRSVFTFARKNHQIYRFIFAAHQTELRRETRKKMGHIDPLMRIIEFGQEHGYFRKQNVQLAATMVLGVITQTIFYLKNGDLKINFADVLFETEAACLRMLK